MLFFQMFLTVFYFILPIFCHLLYFMIQNFWEEQEQLHYTCFINHLKLFYDNSAS